MTNTASTIEKTRDEYIMTCLEQCRAAPSRYRYVDLKQLAQHSRFDERDVLISLERLFFAQRIEIGRRTVEMFLPQEQTTLRFRIVDQVDEDSDWNASWTRYYAPRPNPSSEFMTAVGGRNIAQQIVAVVKHWATYTVGPRYTGQQIIAAAPQLYSIDVLDDDTVQVTPVGLLLKILTHRALKTDTPYEVWLQVQHYLPKLIQEEKEAKANDVHAAAGDAGTTAGG
jgi:hypothetical protein